MPWYKKSKIFVLSSRYEGTPNVLLEAVSMHLPTIITNSCYGAKYYLKNNKKKYNYVSENVIIGPGTKELMFLLHLLFDGDVILPVPSWVSYEPQALLGRNKIHWLETTSSNNWFPTAESLEKIISKNKNFELIYFLKGSSKSIVSSLLGLVEILDIFVSMNSSIAFT